MIDTVETSAANLGTYKFNKESKEWTKHSHQNAFISYSHKTSDTINTDRMIFEESQGENYLGGDEMALKFKFQLDDGDFFE